MSRSRLLHRPLSTLASTPVVVANPARPVRLPSEAPKQSHLSQLALTQPTPTPPLFPCTPPREQQFAGPSNQIQSPHTAQPAHPPTQDGPRRAKKPRLEYTLEVGAYGIAKHRPAPSPTAHLHPSDPASTSRAVQVGEDAYFVRPDAVGVADGVGGWARGAPPCAGPTPSALFARRLMHFCADELDIAASYAGETSHRSGNFYSTTSTDSSSLHTSYSSSNHLHNVSPAPVPSAPVFAFEHRLRPRAPSPASLPVSLHTAYPSTVPKRPIPASSLPGYDFSSATYPHLHSVPHLHSAPAPLSHASQHSVPFPDLESGEAALDSDDADCDLEELADAFNVLHILERAYDRTVRAHAPLCTGSSTALLAVLDHPPDVCKAQPLNETSVTNETTVGDARSSFTTMSPADPHANYAVGRLWADAHASSPSPELSIDAVTGRIKKESEGGEDGDKADAVVRIAHLGDCMGMLVRGDRIAWRSDEMWSGYNRPLQLGPPMPQQHRPHAMSASASHLGDSAGPDTDAPHALPLAPHTFSLPVRAHDILVLASDGLSDNLWDEDVLEEVVAVRRLWGDSLPSTIHDPSVMDLPPMEERKEQGALARLLAEALCSRAQRVAARRGCRSAGDAGARGKSRGSYAAAVSSGAGRGAMEGGDGAAGDAVRADEVPFARRAKLAGKAFSGGKCDDITVVVAIIAPLPSASQPAVGGVGGVLRALGGGAFGPAADAAA